MYRVGFPFWKVLARMGMPMRLRVDISHDPEANVYLAQSPDLDGLIVEGRTLEDLKNEALLAASILLKLTLHRETPQARADFRLSSELHHAA